MLKINQFAPDFSLPDQGGVSHTLSQYRGQMIFLYFYPKDDTPGCTTEACSIRDNFAEFTDAGVQVFGVSVDSVKKHTKFVEKYQLPFTLLADENKEVVEKYGVWAEKKFMGRAYMGILRTSFLIDSHGKIAKIYENVKPADHVEEVLKDIEELAD